MNASKQTLRIVANVETNPSEPNGGHGTRNDPAVDPLTNLVAAKPGRASAVHRDAVQGGRQRAVHPPAKGGLGERRGQSFELLIRSARACLRAWPRRPSCDGFRQRRSRHSGRCPASENRPAELSRARAVRACLLLVDVQARASARALSFPAGPAVPRPGTARHGNSSEEWRSAGTGTTFRKESPVFFDTFAGNFPSKEQNEMTIPQPKPEPIL